MQAAISLSISFFFFFISTSNQISLLHRLGSFLAFWVQITDPQAATEKNNLK